MVFQSALRRACLFLFYAPVAFAHCDGLDGPVVMDGKRALVQKQVNLALLWVRKSDEGELREAFSLAQAVRKAGGEAETLADKFFFETLVRLHRASEGATYEGLKPAGRVLPPGLQEAEKALATGDLKPVWDLLRESIHRDLHQRFETLQKARIDKEKDPESGRKFVAAYVDYVHFVVQLQEKGHEARPSGQDHPEPHSCDQAE